jgi:hypothetical protein
MLCTRDDLLYRLFTRIKPLEFQWKPLELIRISWLSHSYAETLRKYDFAEYVRRDPNSGRTTAFVPVPCICIERCCT